ncbi:hypothetical protein ACFFSY_20025 [Paenibacillus aurantiacus]|uniref:Uncharacterized protein n=1 Tax=Paenibacillus aurantiacus TaxID=1936118 RepID=A0ABV5KSM7_9BACL
MSYDFGQERAEDPNDTGSRGKSGIQAGVKVTNPFIASGADNRIVVMAAKA